MSNNSEFDLLADLGKLIRKHGPEAFEDLANHIARPEFTEQLAHVLSTSARVSRTVGAEKEKPTTKKSQEDFRSSLLKAQESEPEKAALLLQLYDGLMAKTILPTLKDMNDFALDNDLPELKARARGRAVVPFVKALQSMPLEKARVLCRQLPSARREDDRSLGAWSSIILGKEERSQEAHSLKAVK